MRGRVVIATFVAEFLSPERLECSLETRVAWSQTSEGGVAFLTLHWIGGGVFTICVVG